MNRSTTKAPASLESAYRRIANSVRDQILSGEFLPGARLPSQDQLVETWRSNAFTVHTAVQALVREGWVQSVRGEGVYVTHPKSRFTCAGIYLGANIGSEDHPAYLRRLHESLMSEFRRLKKEVIVFMDTRPERKQEHVFPELAEAIRIRRIQCSVFLATNSINFPALSRLALPSAHVSPLSPNMIDFDMKSFLDGAVQRLAKSGCKSVGLISSVHEEALKSTLYKQFYSVFRGAVREQGLITRKDWIRQPDAFVRESRLEARGYAEFQNIWKLGKRPDGLIVYPDSVVRGVVTAILDIGRPLVTQEMKFAFHRSAQTNFLCPFPAIWGITNGDVLAAGLVRQIQRQFDGQRTTPFFIPVSFQEQLRRM